MLNEIIVSGTMFSRMENQFTDNVQLMISGENDLFDGVRANLSIGQERFLDLFLITDKLLQNIKKTVLLKHSFPQISCHIAASGVLWVSLSTIYARTITALVERQKIRFGTRQSRAHGHSV